MGLFWVHYKNVNQGDIICAETATKAKYIFALNHDVHYCNVRAKTVIKDVQNLRFPSIVLNQMDWLVLPRKK